MDRSRDNRIACYNCGTTNVTGVRSCTNCRAAYYYNCPHCYAWVDISISNCPGCGKKLNWPGEAYGAENIYSPEKSSPAAILLLTSIIVLSIVAFNLISSNSNSVGAVLHTPGIPISNSLPADGLKTAAQPVIEELSLVNTTPSMTQTGSSASYPGSDVDYTGASVSYQTIDITTTNPASASGTGTYVPKPSSYLKMMYPNWGHCSGGSCSGYYQYGQ